MPENNRPVISVVIPSFNTGDYISRCLDSVQKQTFSAIEIICVDDGSVDETPKILSQHAAMDPRIRVITLPENHGVPYARNLALDEAKGEYVYFMDSDDWIDPDYLEAMCAHAVETGQNVVINANWLIEEDGSNRRTRSGDFGFIKEGAGYYSPGMVQRRFFPVVWTRLYRLDYLRVNNIKSPLLKGGVEDNFFTGLAEILQERSYIFHGPFYHYTQRKGSLVTRPDTGFLHFENFRLFHDELVKRGLPKGAARLFFCHTKMIIANQEQFAFLRHFFLDVEDEVRAFPSYYSDYDLFLMDAVLECEDYKAWLAKYKPSVLMSFVSNKNKR
jgi:glycosyltransferase involved in cell wall biosynthesis